MFFETIKLLNGRLQNLSYHQARMDRTLQQHFPSEKAIQLDYLTPIAEKYPEGLYKLRVDYDTQVREMTIQAYQIKTHHKLKILDAGDFDYSFKSADRSFFDSKLKEFRDCDDLLFTRNGFLTDTTYCNIALFDGKEWITPSTYLLPGTKRSQLIQDNKLKEKPIDMNHLKDYHQICFINAMRDFEKRYTFVVQQDEILLTEYEH